MKRLPDTLKSKPLSDIDLGEFFFLLRPSATKQKQWSTQQSVGGPVPNPNPAQAGECFLLHGPGL